MAAMVPGLQQSDRCSKQIHGHEAEPSAAKASPDVSTLHGTFETQSSRAVRTAQTCHEKVDSYLLARRNAAAIPDAGTRRNEHDVQPTVIAHVNIR